MTILGAVEVADHTVKAFVAGTVPLGDLAREHAHRAQEVKATAPGKVEDLHEDACCGRCKCAWALEVFCREGGVVDARCDHLLERALRDGGDVKVPLDTLVDEASHFISAGADREAAGRAAAFRSRFAAGIDYRSMRKVALSPGGGRGRLLYIGCAVQPAFARGCHWRGTACARQGLEDSGWWFGLRLH